MKRYFFAYLWCTKVKKTAKEAVKRTPGKRLGRTLKGALGKKPRRMSKGALRRAPRGTPGRRT